METGDGTFFGKRVFCRCRHWLDQWGKIEALWPGGPVALGPAQTSAREWNPGTSEVPERTGEHERASYDLQGYDVSPNHSPVQLGMTSFAPLCSPLLRDRVGWNQKGRSQLRRKERWLLPGWKCGHNTDPGCTTRGSPGGSCWRKSQRPRESARGL